MLQRLERSDLYKNNASRCHPTACEDGTPRKKARSQALRQAKDMNSARERLFVVGRPSWPTDEDHTTSHRVRQEDAD
jgi:hypothetical protein